MTTINYSITVSDALSTPHAITSIHKTNGHYLHLVLDNGKDITIDEYDIPTHDLIPTEDMYIVRIAKG